MCKYKEVKMLLKKMILKNFFSYENVEINFDDIPSICAILGQNEKKNSKSNGAGKSALYQGVLYALYEKTRLSANKNATLNDIIKRKSNGKMLVELQFEINKNLYQIIRTRDKNTNKGNCEFNVWDGKKWKALQSSSKKMSNKDIQDVIGIDYNTFISSVLFESDEINRFVNATTSERKEIIKDILQLGRYDNYKNITKGKLDSLKDTITSIENQLLSINSNSLDVEIKEDELSEISKKHILLEMENKSLSNQLERLRLEQIKYNQKIQDRIHLSQKIKDREDNLRKISISLEGSESKLIKYKEIFEKRKEEFQEINKKYIELKESFDLDKDTLIEEGRTAQQKLKEVEENLKKIEKDFHNKEGEINSALASILKIEKLTCGKCPTCYGEIDDNSKNGAILCLTNYKNILDKDLSDLNSMRIENKELVQLAKNKVDILKEKIQQYNEWVKDKKHLQQQLSNIKESGEEAKQIIKDQESIIQENGDLKNSYSKDLDIFKVELSKISVDAPAFDQLNDQISEKNRKLDQSNRMINDSFIKKSRVEIEIENIKKAIEKRKTLVDQRDIFVKERSHYSCLLDIFGKEIPTIMIENSCRDLAIYANEILESISDLRIEFVTQQNSIKGEAKEVFEVYVYKNGDNDQYLIDNLSMGEKFRTVFAIRIALSKLLAKRSNSPAIQFLFYDECFSVLDEEGIEQVVDIFNFLEKEFRHQLVITHRNDLKDYFLNRTILVKKENDNSTLEYQF